MDGCRKNLPFYDPIVKFIFDVEDAFDIESRGVVVTGAIPGEWIHAQPFFLQPGDSVVLEFASGDKHAATIGGVDVFTPPIGTPYGEIPKRRSIGILLSGVARASDVPRGTKLYSDGTGW